MEFMTTGSWLYFRMESKRERERLWWINTITSMLDVRGISRGSGKGQARVHYIICFFSFSLIDSGFVIQFTHYKTALRKAITKAFPVKMFSHLLKYTMSNLKPLLRTT